MKTMMAKFFAASLVAAVCGAALAVDTSTDVLLWHIDLTDNWSTRYSPDFDGIKFYMVSSDGSSKIDLTPKTYATREDLAKLIVGESVQALGNDGTISGSTILPNGTGRVAGYYYTELSSYGSGYSFMAETWAGNTMSTWLLSPVSYETLQQAGAIAALNDLLGTSDLNPQHSYSSFNMGKEMVPEPSGGLLMLLGGALLALRRKREA